MGDEGKNNSETHEADVASPQSGQPRQPHDLQGVLRYAIEAGTAATHELNQPQPLDEEKARFLSEALSSMSVDVIKEMMEALDCLKAVRDQTCPCHDTTAFEDALELIFNDVDLIDNAKDFCKIGGFEGMFDCIMSSYPSVRWRAANVIATVCQNNPFCQSLAVQKGFIPIFMKMCENEKDELCRVKALYALSNIVRESDEALKTFILLNGFSFLLRCMNTDIEKIQVKSAFLLASFTSTQEIKDSLCKMGFVEQLAALIRKEHSRSHEHFISALLTLVTDHPPSQEECRRPELNLKSYFADLIKEYGNDEAYAEEIQYAQKIVELVFSSDSEEEKEER